MDTFTHFIISQIVLFFIVGCGNSSTNYTTLVESCSKADTSMTNISDDWSNVEGQLSSDKNLYIRSLIVDNEDSQLTLFAPKIESREEYPQMYDFPTSTIVLDEQNDITFDFSLSLEQFEATDSIYIRYKDRCFTSSIPNSIADNPTTIMNFTEIK